MGRSPECDLVLADGASSRKHAAIERQGDVFTLVDLGSNNGTFVAGEKSKVTRHTLRDGDEFTIGRTRLKVGLPEAPKPAAAPAPGDATIVTSRPAAPSAPPPEAAKPAAAEPKKPAAAAPGKPAAPEARHGVGAQNPSDLPIVLTVLDGPDRGMVYSPSKDRITVGRLTTCDVPLNDSAVSRLHATIKRESGGYWIYDENSRNGTDLGSPPKRVFQSELKHGDTLRIGETEIQIDIGAGKASGVAVSDQTMMIGMVGDKTFAMSVRGLTDRERPKSQVSPDEETRVLARGDAKAAAPAPAAAPKPPKIVLRVVEGADKGKTYEPKEGTARFVVGRGEQADFRLGDSGVSTVHFAISERNGQFHLTDEGSRNGTFLGGAPERVSTVTLKGGEKIRVGTTELQVEITGAVAPAPAADGTVVVAAPAAPPKPTESRAAAHSEARPKTAPAKGGKPQEALPELARSADAKQRISKIMKGVSLRPVRVPGTPRQWASLGLILIAVVVSYAFPRSWVSAGPVHKEHADFEAACETCHSAGPGISVFSIREVGTAPLRMNASCASLDCHSDDLLTRADVRDDCVSCHTDHRGRRFNIKGGEELCWSCHTGHESPQDFGTRLMQVAVTKDESLKAMLAPRLRKTETGLRFSHAAHDKETQGDAMYDTCVGCHPTIENERTFALPGHAECLDCHDQAVSADYDVARQKAGPDCLQCHTTESGETVKPPPWPFAYVIFSHKDHLPGEACKSCHARIWDEIPYEKVVREPDLYPVAMDACYTCHQQKMATLACLDCHREHHSFSVAEGEVPPPGAPNRGFNGFLLVLMTLTLGAIGYTYGNMRVAKRFLEPPPPPPAGPKGGGGGAPAGGGAEPAGEVMPFPKVDIEACISCSSCYGSCPKQVLAGDDHGKSQVVNPDSCIALEGCAVCEQGCPTGAIRVSTAPLKRTVERPEIDDHNEAVKLPGLFFAGEVIGAALIKSAINQGNDCVKYILDKKPKVADAPYDVIIVGAGPAGLGAGLAAKTKGLRYLVLERDTIASTIMNYPRDKAVLAEPIKMPLGGALPMMDAEKDTLIKVWRTIVSDAGLEVKEFEEVKDVKKKEALLEVTTVKGSYLGTNVLLSIGTRGNPRKLGCAGEDPKRVAYNLIDAADWKGKKVLVVGGGDSAIEAAVALAQAENTTVTLSYRKGEFARVKKRNLENIDQVVKAGRLELVFNSSVQEVRASDVVLKTESGPRELPCDQIFALIGADPPKGWIEKLGIAFVEREEEVITWS